MKIQSHSLNATRPHWCLLTVLLFLLGGKEASAESFGINFLGNTPSSLVTGTAGVIPISGWNNISNTNFSSGTIYSSDRAVAAVLTLTGSGKGNGWNNGSVADAGNGALMKGYQDSAANSPATNTISGLTGSLYTVYLYTEGDQRRPSGGTEMLPNYTVNGVRYYTATLGGAFAGYLQGGIAQVNTNTYPSSLIYGNYIIIDNVIPVAGVITISANSDNRTWRSPLNGIEIVARTNAPQLLTQPAAQRLYTTGVAQLSVVAGGNAPFFYSWRKNGVSLTESARVSGTATSVLILTNLSTSDTGNYDVVVSNAFSNTVSSVARLEVVVETTADTAFDAFNAAYLVTSGGLTYYKAAINNSASDGFWTEALDIMGAEDAYERTGSPQQKQLINNLLTTFLVQNPPSWSWDGWNDDIGWVTIALARGYQMTGNANFLAQAEYGYNYAFARGWDTNYNNGGIWEQQPSYSGTNTVEKCPLSNNSLAKTACLLYQSTSNSVYLTQAKQIYAWGQTNIFNTNSGRVYAGVWTNGVVDQGTAVYNQGTFIDMAGYLYQITGDPMYLNDALKAVEYTRNNLTVNGILSNGAGYLNTWADEFARGLGHLVKNNNLWSTYYPWMLANANAAWSVRRTDYNLTWNAWVQQTPSTNTMIPTWCVSAVAMWQFVPLVEPGLINCTNKVSGTAIGTSGAWGGSGNTIAKVFDGNLTTFFDGVDASGDWVGLDFGAGVSNVIGQINYWPRSGYASRMLGGVFQGANTSNFSSPTTLFVVASAPPENNVVTSQSITNTKAFRYVRYLGPANGSCNVAEIQFFSPNPPAPPVRLIASAVAGAPQTLSLSWQGSATLMEATNVAGPWTTNFSVSPFVVPTTRAAAFYRLLVP